MRYNDLTTEQTKALLDAIRDLPEGWRDLDDGDLLARLTGGETEGESGPDPAPDPTPEGETDPVVIEPTPQGVFRFSVPTSGWGAESYRVHWGDESAAVENGRGGSRATLADIERALEGLDGIRDVEVTAPGASGLIEGTGGRPYLVNVLDAAPGSLRVEKGNGKSASVRVVDDDPAPVDPGGGPGASTGPTTLVFEHEAYSGTPVFQYQAYPLGLWPLGVTAEYQTPPFEVAFYTPTGRVFDRADGRGNTVPYVEMRPEFYADAPSRIEAALVSLPNVATARVTLSSNKWRIELTEGPGGIERLVVAAGVWPGDMGQGGQPGGGLDILGGATLHPLSLGAPAPADPDPDPGGFDPGPDPYTIARDTYQALVAERGGRGDRSVQLEGGPGNDHLTGTAADDQLDGRAGADTLDGGLGSDHLAGGPGADTFIFRPGDALHHEAFSDVIVDFDYAAGDRIRLIGFSSDNLALSGLTDDDGDGFLDDQVLTLPDGGRIFLLNVGDSLAELAIENIII